MQNASKRHIHYGLCNIWTFCNLRQFAFKALRQGNGSLNPLFTFSVFSVTYSVQYLDPIYRDNYFFDNLLRAVSIQHSESSFSCPNKKECNKNSREQKASFLSEKNKRLPSNILIVQKTVKARIYFPQKCKKFHALQSITRNGKTSNIV